MVLKLAEVQLESELSRTKDDWIELCRDSGLSADSGRSSPDAIELVGCSTLLCGCDGRFLDRAECGRIHV